MGISLEDTKAENFSALFNERERVLYSLCHGLGYSEIVRPLVGSLGEKFAR